MWTLLHDTVHKVNSRDYTKSQLNAWAPSHWDMSAWSTRLSTTQPFVAVDGNTPIGFAELEEDGHIDCFYTASDRQGEGVGRSLLAAIETKASQLGLTHIYAEASITARGFFESMGFMVEREQSVTLRGERFTNFVVSKRI